MLEADERPEELDLLFEELNREDPEARAAPVEEIDSLVPEISKMKIEPAEVSAGGSPVTFSKVKKSQFQGFLHRMVQPLGSSSSETLA